MKLLKNGTMKEPDFKVDNSLASFFITLLSFSSYVSTLSNLNLRWLQNFQCPTVSSFVMGSSASFGKQFGVCLHSSSLLIEITYQRGIPDTSFTCLHLTGITFKQQNRRKTTEFQYDIQSRKMTSRLRQLVDNFTAGKRFK